jgi:hypothetical protein
MSTGAPVQRKPGCVVHDCPHLPVELVDALAA